jgi:hypothetical protein
LLIHQVPDERELGVELLLPPGRDVGEAGERRLLDTSLERYAERTVLPCPSASETACRTFMISA